MDANRFEVKGGADSKQGARDFSGAREAARAPALDISGANGTLAEVMQVSDIRERLNQFLHRQNIRRLTPAERAMAREWCIDVISREHPELDEEQRERFYENLIQVRIIAVDEWTHRMSA